MREFIDQRDRGPSSQCAIEIEVAQCVAAVGNLYRWHLLETFEQAFSFDATMRLDVTDHHIGARRSCSSRGFQHGVCLANAGRGTEENSQATPARACLVALHIDE